MSGDPGENARGLHAPRPHTPPPVDSVAAGASLNYGLPRARRCRQYFLTLGRRRTPALLWAPVAPSPLSVPAPFKPISRAPHCASPVARVSYRELLVPPPSLCRSQPSARGRGHSGRLSSPHQTKKLRPPRSYEMPRARARFPQPPPPTRCPRPHCARTRRLPPSTGGLFNFRHPLGLGRAPAAFPLSLRLRVLPWAGRSGRDPQGARAQTPSRNDLLLRTKVFVLT